MTSEILYTPEELAQKLKISKYTVYEMIKRGEIEAHHIGRNIRVSESQLDDYLMNSRRVENVFDAFIEYEGGIQYAVIRDVKISVSTPLEGKVKVCVKPEDIIISKGTFVSSARNIFLGRIQDLMYDDKKSIKWIIFKPFVIVIFPFHKILLYNRPLTSYNKAY